MASAEQACDFKNMHSAIHFAKLSVRQIYCIYGTSSISTLQLIAWVHDNLHASVQTISPIKLDEIFYRSRQTNC